MDLASPWHHTVARGKAMPLPLRIPLKMLIATYPGLWQRMGIPQALLPFSALARLQLQGEFRITQGICLDQFKCILRHLLEASRTIRVHRWLMTNGHSAQ